MMEGKKESIERLRRNMKEGKRKKKVEVSKKGNKEERNKKKLEEKVEKKTVYRG